MKYSDKNIHYLIECSCMNDIFYNQVIKFVCEILSMNRDISMWQFWDIPWICNDFDTLRCMQRFKTWSITISEPMLYHLRCCYDVLCCDVIVCSTDDLQWSVLTMKILYTICVSDEQHTVRDLQSSVVIRALQLPFPDSKVHGANMGPTWVLSAPDGPHVGPMNFTIRVAMFGSGVCYNKILRAEALLAACILFYECR